MLGRTAVLALLAACGFRSPSTAGDATDAPHELPGDATGGDDDATVPTGCFAHWASHQLQFTGPNPVTVANTIAMERDPFLTLDQLTLYFASDRASVAGVGDVFMTTRQTVTSAWRMPGLVGDMSSGGDDSKLSITDDGQLAILASETINTGAQGGLDVWLAPASGGSFGPFTQAHLAAVNDAGDQFDPEISANGLDIYLAPRFGGTQHIAMAARSDPAGDFSAPSMLASLASAAGDADPTVSPDERVIVFASRRPGGTGATDLWYATRGSKTLPFDPPIHLAINSVDDDSDPMLSHDGCHLLFSRHVGLGDWDLYQADLTP